MRLYPEPKITAILAAWLDERAVRARIHAHRRRPLGGRAPRPGHQTPGGSRPATAGPASLRKRGRGPRLCPAGDLEVGVREADKAAVGEGSITMILLPFSLYASLTLSPSTWLLESRLRRQ